MVDGEIVASGERDRALVSIVLPTYNGEQYLAEAIASCLEQTHRELELIVVDDGSRINVRPLISATKDSRVRYLRHETNAGLPSALNTGFAEARGAYLTWTSDDNRYHPEAIARMVECLAAHPHVGLVYAACRVIDGQGRLVASLPAEPPDRIWTMNCVRACFLYRREVQDCVGLYDPAVLLVEDYDYWLRTARWFTLRHIAAELYDIRDHPDRLTRTMSLDRRRDSHLRVLQKLGDPTLGPPVPAGVRRQARILLHITCGRDYFFAGRTREARRDLWAAIRLQPRNLTRRQVIEPLLKALAGDRLVARVRARHGVQPERHGDDVSLR